MECVIISVLACVAILQLITFFVLQRLFKNQDEVIDRLEFLEKNQHIAYLRLIEQCIILFEDRINKLNEEIKLCIEKEQYEKVKELQNYIEKYKGNINDLSNNYEEILERLNRNY